MTECYKRLREAMQLRNKTQADLCEETGIPKSAMSQYVSGKFTPKQTRLYLLAKALNVNEAWLMGCDAPIERLSDADRKTAASPIDEAAIKKIESLTSAEREEVFKFIDFLKSKRQ